MTLNNINFDPLYIPAPSYQGPLTVTSNTYTLLDGVTSDQIFNNSILPGTPATILGNNGISFVGLPVGTYKVKIDTLYSSSQTSSITLPDIYSVAELPTSNIDSFTSGVLSGISATSPITFNSTTGIIALTGNSVTPGTYNSVTLTGNGFITAATSIGYLVTAVTSLNGQTGTTQIFSFPGTSGTSPNWVSSTDDHTLNLPLASTSGVTSGLISNIDYTTFAAKQAALGYTPANKAGDTFTGQLNTSVFGIVGSGGRIGNARLVAGTVFVSLSSVTSNSRIFLTMAATGGTVGFLSTLTSTGSGFTINSTSNTDTSLVSYVVVEIV